MPTPGTTDFAQPPTSSRRFVRRLAAGVLLINLFVCGMVTWSLYQSHDEYRRRAEVTAANLSQVLAQNIAGAIEKIDVTLLAAADEIERRGAKGAIDRAASNAALVRLQERVPEILSLRSTDAVGMAEFGRGIDPAAPPNNSDREYFTRQRDNPAAGLVIAKPVFTRIDKKWAIPISRPLRSRDGSFGGVVYVNVGLAHLASMFSSLDIGSHGVVILRDGEMGLVARYPEPADIGRSIGDTTVAPEQRQLLDAGRRSGAFSTSSGADQRARAVSFRRIGDYPLYVTVALAREDYLAEWWDEALQMTTLAALFALITVALSWLIQRTWRRQLGATLELAREEEKFHTVADYTYDWEYWEGVGGAILFMSPSCVRVTGYSPADFTAAPDLLGRIVHPDDRHAMAAHRHDAANADEAGVDFRIVRRDGEIRWIAHGCRAVFGRDGQFMGRRVSNRDITERKRAEGEVQRASAYNRSLIEASLDPLVTIGPDGKITDVNAATETVTGLARDRLIGTEFSDYFSDPDKARAGYRHVFRAGGVRDYDLEIRHRDGHLTPVRYNAAIYRDDGGKMIGVFAAARDMTERKRAEDMVRRLNAELELRVAQRTAQLEAANKELEGFSYSMSHDMRTPLRAIDGFAQILREEHGGRLDAEGRRLLKAVRDNAQRMGRQIDDILRFLRLGKRRLEYERVDMDQLARDVFAELRAAAPARRLRLDAAELPAAWGDRELVRQVLRNLLSNAVKFSPPETEAVIELSAAVEEAQCVYAVQDHGVGFDMRYVDKLFKVFERVHPTGQYEGTGIGLAIVKRIVERHGGHVWAEGQVGAGATFHFSLPNGGNDMSHGVGPALAVSTA